MQQAVVALLDFEWPRLVGTEEVLLYAVEVSAAAAFEDECPEGQWSLPTSSESEVCLQTVDSIPG